MNLAGNNYLAEDQFQLMAACSNVTAMEVRKAELTIETVTNAKWKAVWAAERTWLRHNREAKIYPAGDRHVC